MSLVRLIAAGDTAAALQIIATKPPLARAAFSQNATRKDSNTYYLDAIGCYIYRAIPRATSRPLPNPTESE